MRDYGKIYVSFWTSEDTASLSPEAKLLAAYLLSGPHTNMIGCFRLPLAYPSADLRFSAETVSRGLAELSRNGFATYDEKFEWVVIHKFLKWNRMQNPNQGKAAAKLMEQIPASSTVNPILAEAFDQFGENLPEESLKQFRKRFETVPVTVSKPLPKGCGSVAETILKPFRNGFPEVHATVSEPFRNQEQEQEKKQDPDSASQAYQNKQEISVDMHSASVDAACVEVTAEDPLTPTVEPVGASAATDPQVYLTRRKRKLSGWKLHAFNEFWESFGLKKGRAEAADAWLDIPALSPELTRKIIDAAGKEARARPALVSKGQTPKWAQGWLSARRWEDWEGDGASTRSLDGPPGQKEDGIAKTTLSREEEEAQYRETIREALKRFL